MTPVDIKKAADLLAQVEEINSTIRLLKQQNHLKWHFAVANDIEPYTCNTTVQVPVGVKCIGITPIIRFLESERKNRILELEGMQVDAKGLEIVRY